MKIKFIILALLALLASRGVYAYDFSKDGIYYNRNSDGKSVTVVGASSGDITIPSTVKPIFGEVTYNVTSIGVDAFFNQSGLTSVTIGNNVTSIGDRAFWGCSGLTSVTIPNSVTSIGSDAFSYCSGLTSVTIGNNVTSIGSNAFWCSGLTSITIPESVTSIGNDVFGACDLTSIVVEAGNTKYDSRNNCNAIIETSSNTLISGCKNTVIPNDVTSIATHAFENCSGLTSITIPNGVTSIGANAFKNCSSLTSVTIPNTVTSINGYAFEGSGLTSITIPNSVTSINGGIFRNCSSLTSIYIPESVTGISEDAFSGCSSLTSVTLNSNSLVSKNYTSSSNLNTIFGSQVKEITIGDDVTSIGQNAFYNFDGLTSVTIPNSVTTISNSAFASCEGLTSVTIGNNVTYIGNNIFSGCNKLVRMDVLAETPPSIGYWTFSDRANIILFVPEGKKATYEAADYWKEFKLIIDEPLPIIFFADANVKAICVANWDTDGNGELDENEAAAVDDLGEVFKNNTTIKSFDELKYFTGLTTIGDYAFQSCSSLTSVTIPETVTSIGQNAFYGCSSLTKAEFASIESLCNISFTGNAYGNPLSFAHHLYIDGQEVKDLVIPESVTSIRFATFFGCSGLTSVTIPNSVTSINLSAFHSCSGLTSATLGNSVNSIGNYAFYNCSNLSSINIPESVTSIGDAAFYGCTSLPVFDNIRYADIYLIEAVDKTQSSYTIKSGTRYIGKVAFQNCSYLTSITIPESVTIIDDNAFEGCTSLPVIDNVRYADTYLIEAVDKTLSTYNIKSGTRFIGNGAFENCCLTSITIPNSVTSISGSAFNSCSGLTSVTLNSNIIVSTDYFTIWNLRAIFGSQVTEYIIGDDVTSIGRLAFYNCTNLSSVTIGCSVTSIGNEAFYGCSGLTSITIPETVTSIGKNTFYGCSSLTKAEFASIESLCGISFNTNYANPLLYAHHLYVDGIEVKDLVIPESVTSIRFATFWGCSGLTSVTIPNGVTSIGQSAFLFCSGLTSVTISNSVTSIGPWAFQYCSGLTSITIPESVTSIGGGAFDGCTCLTSVNALAETPSSIQSTTIPSTIAKIRVPEASVSAYKAAENWSAFSAKIMALGGEDNSITVEEIEENKAAGGSANQTYIVTDAAADDVKAADNVIVHSGDNYTCANLVLSDGEPFETMADEFTAAAATYTRSVSVGNTSGTICVPYAFAKEDGVKYYTVDNTRSDDATIYLNEISDDIIPAATPVIYFKDGGKTTMTFSGSNAVAKKAAGTGSGTFELRGTFEKMTITDSDELAKSYALSGGKFLCSTTKLTINPFRAYLYNTGAVAEARLNLSVEDDDEPTGITSENVALMSGDAEIEGYYTLEGKRVGSLQKGVVTVIRYANGKSVKVFAQ